MASLSNLLALVLNTFSSILLSGLWVVTGRIKNFLKIYILYYLQRLNKDIIYLSILFTYFYNYHISYNQYLIPCNAFVNTEMGKGRCCILDNIFYFLFFHYYFLRRMIYVLDVQEHSENPHISC